MAGIRTENKIYEVGIYCRLSKDDGTDNESASIATQKSILTDYVKRQGWHLAKTYVDDGYSGTNFQRPSFQNMIKDIENGLINCVITKDLSRLGRNYLDCGLYLEVFFPEHNVRYIAVNDGVDTLNKSAMDITPFRNILNEMYSADVSVKIKSAYRARFQQGKFMGTTAPYGYVKDPADHNHLLIDDKVAHVVREIFDLALAGNGIAKIRKHINKQHILRPAAYAVEQGANLGNVITDAYLLATGADIAFENAGGIRASIAAGTVTYGDVINVSPYGNYVVTKKLTGAQIKEMLESSLTIQKNCIVANDSGEWDAWPNDSGSYLQVGGITVRFDPAQPAGERVLSVQKDGQELDDTKEYTVAVNNYLAGSDSYPQLADAAEVGEYSCCEELLIQFFEQGSDAVTASAAKQNMIQTTKETVEPEQPSVPVTPSVPEQPSKEQPEAAKTEVKKEQASGTKTSVKSPKTADSNELFCWMILLLLSGGAGSICLVQGNKR